MKVLITGGAGFIGSHTADALLDAGHEVRIMDNLHPTVHPLGKPGHIRSEVEFIIGDVRDKSAFTEALAGVDAVYHFAAYQDYLVDFSTFFSVNSVSTALLYEILVETGMADRISKVIVAASQAVMGEGRYRCSNCFEENPFDIFPGIRLEKQLAAGEWDHRCPHCGQILSWQTSDETVMNPCNPYAISKQSQENIAIHLGSRYDIPSVVMRFSIVQGARQSFYNAYSGAMRIFALSLLGNRSPLIYEDGKQIRDYVDIRDVISANLLVLSDPRADYQVFNIGGNQAWTVNQFYEAMQETIGKHLAPVREGYYRYGDTRHIFSNVGKLQSLGWRPTRTIADSIRSYWEYLTEQNRPEEILEYAERHMKHLRVIRKSGVSL